MAKTKAGPIGRAVSNITRAQALLKSARNTAPRPIKKRLTAEIDRLEGIKRKLIVYCHGTFSVIPVGQ